MRRTLALLKFWNAPLMVTRTEPAVVGWRWTIRVSAPDGPVTSSVPRVERTAVRRSRPSRFSTAAPQADEMAGLRARERFDGTRDIFSLQFARLGGMPTTFVGVNLT